MAISWEIAKTAVRRFSTQRLHAFILSAPLRRSVAIPHEFAGDVGVKVLPERAKQFRQLAAVRKCGVYKSLPPVDFNARRFSASSITENSVLS
jgi:hypothetical protein